jgi:hypothetical protein
MSRWLAILLAVDTFLALLTGGGLAVIGGLLSGLMTNWLGGDTRST